MNKQEFMELFEKHQNKKLQVSENVIDLDRDNKAEDETKSTTEPEIKSETADNQDNTEGVGEE